MGWFVFIAKYIQKRGTMPETTPGTVLNIEGYSKPADILIGKISDAVGELLIPYQIMKVAAAESDTALFKDQTKTVLTDLYRRAMHRFIEEEAQRQQNMEQITLKALQQLDEEADPNSMEKDWLINFFERSRLISDEEMQALLARVLSEEANSPGTFSKRTVNYLCDLDKVDAENFQALCSFGWFVGEFTPLVFDVKAEVYRNHGVTYDTLSRLERIGLIRFRNYSGYMLADLPKTVIVAYCSQPLVLTLEKEKKNRLYLGNVRLTPIGNEIATICYARRVDGFEDYVKEIWKKYL
jgi:hypothetical protein